MFAQAPSHAFSKHAKNLKLSTYSEPLTMRSTFTTLISHRMPKRVDHVQDRTVCCPWQHADAATHCAKEVSFPFAYDDVFLVAGLQREYHLAEVVRGQGLRKPLGIAVLSQHAVQLAVAGALEHQIDLFFVEKVGVETEQILVPQVRLDQDFPPQVATHPVFHQLRLVEDLVTTCLI